MLGSSVRIFVSILGLLSCFSCHPGKVSSEELVEYVSDESNGLRRSAIIQGTLIEVTYRPVDLLIAQNIEGETFNRMLIDELQKKYSQNMYFTVSFSRNGADMLQQSGPQYRDILETLSFEMERYTTMTTSSNDTIPIGDYVLNRTYGHSTSTDLLFVFDARKITENNWLQLNLNEFGLGIGNQRFRFDVNDLKETPEIDFQNL
jgi:hypothetical protein